MKLYRSPNYSESWFALGAKTGWVMFPAEVNGWEKRQAILVRDLPPMNLCQVPLWLGFNTGLPGAPHIEGNLPCASQGSMKAAA